MPEETVRSFLRSLTHELGQLCERCDRWLAQKHCWPYDNDQLQKIRQLVEHLRRKSGELASTEIIGILVLMGGTGVGKSTLLNALAQQRIAPVSVQRPTTRRPVCYIHADIPQNVLPHSILGIASLHHNDALRNKIIVDAPDIDSRETENYQRLREILPHADIILYVGSPEKYHDQIGWELFREFSRSKAFAFVLNRWDECANREKIGIPPDEDWLQDLHAEGYVSPLLFRTSALLWMENRQHELPPGEQFSELRRWLEAEIGERELLAIRQTNLEMLLRDLIECLAQLVRSVCVCDQDIWQAWQKILEEEIEQFLARCERFLGEHQEGISKFLREESHRRIPGWLARGLGLLRGWYSKPTSVSSAVSTSTYITDLIHDWTRILGASYLRYYEVDLTDRLLVAANAQGVPVMVLEEPLQRVARQDWPHFWKEQVTEAMTESLQSLWQTTGWRGGLRSLAQWLPGRLCWLAGFAGLGVLIHRMFIAEAPYSPGLGDVLYFLLPFFLAEGMSYALVYYLSPRNWQAVASIVKERLRQRAGKSLSMAYKQTLENVLDQVREELRLLQQALDLANQLIQQIEQKREAIEMVRRLYRQ